MKLLTFHFIKFKEDSEALYCTATVQKIQEVKEYESKHDSEGFWYEEEEKDSIKQQISSEIPSSSKDWENETKDILDFSNDSVSVKREESVEGDLLSEIQIKEEIESVDKTRQNSQRQEQSEHGPDFRNINPKMIFHYLFDENIIKLAVDGINTCWKAHPSPTAKKLKWVDVTESELKNFIGVLFLMGIIRKVRLRDHWATETQKTASVKDLMSQGRFEQILHCFEAVNEKGLPSSFLTSMVSQFCNSILMNSRKFYQTSKVLTLDSTKVRLGYSNKAKLAACEEDQIRAYLVTEAATGFVLNCELRKSNERDRHCLIESALRLLSPLRDDNFSVYLASECTSNKLLSDLSKLNIKACGKIWPKLLEVPPALHKELYSLPHIASRQYLINNQTIGIWKDDKGVDCMLSTIHFPTEDKRNSLFNRISREEKSSYTTLKDKLTLDEMMKSYDINIDGVKQFDEKMVRYSNNHIFASQRLPLLIFYFSLEVAMVNSYIIYLSSRHEGKRIIGPKDFRILVIETLSGATETNSNPIQNIRITKESLREQNVESLSKMGRCFLISVERAAICKVCCSDPTNHRIRTSYRCQTCQIPVCVVGCYDYHRLIVEGGKLLVR